MDNPYFADKFFFGTDYPMWNAKQEIERFMQINLTKETREKIFAKNLKILRFCRDFEGFLNLERARAKLKNISDL